MKVMEHSIEFIFGYSRKLQEAAENATGEDSSDLQPSSLDASLTGTPDESIAPALPKQTKVAKLATFQSIVPNATFIERSLTSIERADKKR